ncbi:MAG: 6-carboxytetrahydropterin synthase QueD [Candidatus Zipacnadales bacterium]
MSSKTYELVVHQHFSAAHALRHYEGPCASLHGHNYQVEVAIECKSLDELGMVMDFRELKRLCSEVVNTLDHQLLNDLPPFREANPTSERLAEYIYGQIASRLVKHPVRLCFVRVWETPTSAATYRED